jgi:hypothetical protein
VNRLCFVVSLRGLPRRIWQHNKKKASLENSRKAFGERRVGKN